MCRCSVPEKLSNAAQHQVFYHQHSQQGTDVQFTVMKTSLHAVHCQNCMAVYLIYVALPGDVHIDCFTPRGDICRRVCHCLAGCIVLTYKLYP